jgi:hypothetical protein
LHTTKSENEKVLSIRGQASLSFVRAEGNEGPYIFKNEKDKEFTVNKDEMYDLFVDPDRSDLHYLTLDNFPDEGLDICSKGLEGISVKNCTNLKKLQISSNALTCITVENCAGLESIEAECSEKLKKVVVNNCENIDDIVINNKFENEELPSAGCKCAVSEIKDDGSFYVFFSIKNCEKLETGKSLIEKVDKHSSQRMVRYSIEKSSGQN